MSEPRSPATHHEEWWLVRGRSAVRDLWASLTWQGKPKYGPWLLPDGRDVVKLVAEGLLDELGFEIWFKQMDGCRPPLRRNDLLNAGGLPLKVASTRFVAALHDLGVGGFTSREVRVVLRSGEEVPGYHLLAESLDETHEVHSFLPTSRSISLRVSRRVLDGLRERGVTLLDAEPDTRSDRDEPFVDDD